jgi:hypothetical protein
MKKFSDVSDIKLANAALTSSGAVAAEKIDASTYGRVQYIFTLGTPLSGASFNASIWEASAGASSSGTWTAIASGSLAQITAASSKCVAVLDVPVNPSKPWQQVSAAVANSNWPVAVCAELYNGVRRIQAASPQQIVLV